MNLLSKISERESSVPALFSELALQDIPLLFYGAGITASYYYKVFEVQGINIESIVIDDDYHRSSMQFHGRQVHSILTKLNCHERVNVFVAFSTCDITSVEDSLLKTDKVHKVYYLDDPAIFNGIKANYHYDAVIERKREFEESYQMFQDDLSREIMARFINQRISEKRGYLDRVWSRDDYRPIDIFSFHDGETMVDCGAYDGDSIKLMTRYFEAGGIAYEKLIAIEPDRNNYLKLAELQSSLPRLDCINKGVWNERAVLKFNSTGTMGSAVSATATATATATDSIDVDTIDNILAGQSVSYIKMDVEGAELNALMGAEESIKKYKPKLAVSVYHKKIDLVTIPQFIKSLVPEYKIYLRIHRPFSQELVLYATL